MITPKDLDAALQRKHYSEKLRRKLVKDLLADDSGLNIEETPDPGTPQVELFFDMPNGEHCTARFTEYKSGMTVLRAMEQVGNPDTMERVLAQFVATNDPSLHELYDDIQKARADGTLPLPDDDLAIPEVYRAPQEGTTE